MKKLILLVMIFLHVVDDYYLQGILAQLKQKSWWEKNAPDPLYKNDYKVALVTHAFSWTFMIMLPITITMIIHNNYIMVPYLTLFVINWMVHAWVDNLKANELNCSLLVDQVIHLAQIIVTWTIMFYRIKI